MDVIGAGFGRTGTASLQSALQILGYGPCYHWKTLIAEPQRTAHWYQVLSDTAAGGAVGWDTVYAGFRAAVDWPTAAFWRELADFYPEAKVILTVREPHEWYASFAQTISVALGATPPLATTRAAMNEHGIPGAVASDDLMYRVITDRVFGGRVHDKDEVLAVYRAHVNAVVSHLPTERLLLFDPTAGWGPLTEFLGVPQPLDAYPHINRRKDFWQLCAPA
ncbi:sulfotransferase family protein [Kitasatospora purpeofusca]|uniref:sulfotransferase family protein n=1 Tax=Kitasatospora purpeofusca TaxID=67352 RepID=UPI002E12B68C|nr:sulfotransferase family protein [Kitasatospora purpeofusca]WSR37834.1 sulfotransferase family protein [Kitasatospora purpeofusca]